jgi:putative nucleotidyltransferase with HDIG domain
MTNTSAFPTVDHREVAATALPSLVALATTVEARIPFTHAHSQRTAAWAVRLAKAVGLGPSAIARIRAGALLHDVGKIVVPDAILLKAGTLTEDEWVVMRSHAKAGAAIVGLALPELEQAIRHHHERWDGMGYPDGLEGRAIPLDARLIAVADSWDAMISDRSYRRALHPEDAKLILFAGRDVVWDGHLVDVFLELLKRQE